MELQSNLDAIREAGAVLYGVSVPPAEDLEQLRKDAGLEYEILVDEGSALIKQYGVLNAENGVVPHPTVVVIGKDGVVRWVHTDQDYQKRPPASDVLAALLALR